MATRKIEQSTKKPEAAKVTIRRSMNIVELREELSASIRGIRDGTRTAANANAITNAAGKILSTVKTEMEYYKLTGKTPKISLFLADK